MHSYYSTQTVPEADRLQFWNELVRKTYVNLEVKPRSREPFFGSIEVEPLGYTELSIVDSCQQLVRRKFLNTSSNENDLYMLILQARSCGVLKQDHREVRLTPGHWALIDSTRPYEIFGSGHFRHLVMSIPKSYLSKWQRNAKNITAIDLLSTLPLGIVVSEHLKLLFKNLNEVYAEERLLIGESVLNLVSGALMNALTNNNDQVYLSEGNRVEVIKSYIHRHIWDPELSVNSIALALNVSKRYIHKLFEGQGIGVSEYVRNIRLENCHRELQNAAADHRSITDIALKWGFNSLSHFSTLFKKRFGRGPRDVRNQT